MREDPQVRFEFAGDLSVDTDTLEVRCGDQVSLVQPQVFEVLRYLVERADRVITKEELLDNVWGDRFVSESALTSRIKSARQALGDDGRTQAVIRTVHGRGYRWVAERAPAPEATAAPASVEAPAVAERPEPRPALLAVEAPVPVDDPWPAVGRHREMEQLGARLRDPNRHGVVIVAPAGMGKSRLALMAAAVAERSGIPVARVQGYRQSQNIPLACLAHLLPESDQLRLGPDEDLSRTVL